uniref:Putative DNA primase/helicase n=1 Tax=viral metagenome TaxID=1070528 RepID=A0A6H2A0M0_9ZZZZ
MKIDIVKESAGRWPGILSTLGIEVKTNGKHGPCPLCGGKDRFRFDDQDGVGTWICNQCGAGTGFKLIEKKLGVDFLEAVKRVGEIMGDIPKHVKPKPVKDYRKMLNDTWKKATSLVRGDPVVAYLAGRGLKLIPDNVRYYRGCWESETKSRMQAMIALVTGPDGKPVTIHRTYLRDGKKAPIESPRKLMPHNGTLKGAAIRLFEPSAYTMGIAEGIETAIAATQRFQIGTWAAVTAGIMESWEPPEGIKEVIIFGDNDANFTGQKSAYILANRLAKKGIKVNVDIPETIGDWNSYD